MGAVHWHWIDSCSELVQMYQRLLLCTGSRFGKREVLLLWPICISVSQLWLLAGRHEIRLYCQMIISQFWGQGQEAGATGSWWRFLPLHMPDVAGSGFLGLTLSSQEEDEEAEPGDPAPCRGRSCRLSWTAMSTEPEQTESSTAHLRRFVGLPCCWGHLPDPNSKDFAHCQMHWACQQTHRDICFTTRLKK